MPCRPIRLLTLTAIVAFASSVLADEPVAKKESSPEEIVRAAILHFDEQMRSDNAEVREKVFDEVVINEAVLVALFGDEAKELWPQIEVAMKQVRAHTDQFQKELAAKGKLAEIKLIDVRANDISGRYEDVLKMIPKEIPVYRAQQTYEQGTFGTSAYVVIDGKMRHVRGLESLGRAIVDEREKKKLLGP